MKPTQILRVVLVGMLVVAGSARAAPVESKAWWGMIMTDAANEPAPELARVTDRAQLPEVVAKLEQSEARAFAIYRAALARGPQDVRLVAAYHLGAAHLSIAVRARASIASVDFTDPEALNHYRSLHRALEPLIAHHVRDAVAAFQTANAIAEDIPSGTPADPVVRWIVGAVQELLDTIDVI